MRANISLSIAFYILWACTEKPPSATVKFLRTPEEVGRLVTQELLSRPEFMMYETEEVQAVHYAEVCAAYGAVNLAAFLQEPASIEALAKRYDRIEQEGLPNTANHVDANVCGIWPLALFLHTQSEPYLQQGLALADGQWANPLPNGMSSQTRYWIDDVYMISCLQVQAYRATGKRVYLDRAALEADAYIRRLQQPNGLFHHGEHAPFFWGRGNGWVAAGLAELLSVLPKENPHYPSLSTGYQKMMKALLETQAEDGMWRQLIDREESFKETSSTAMFGFAFTVGVNRGILPKEPYRKAYIKAWNALTTYLNEEGKLEEVCVGTGQSTDIAYYLNRPRVVGDFHGQAPLLWLAEGILKNDE